MVNWMASLLAPAQNVNGQLVQYQQDKQRAMGFTGQTGLLEALLREDFNEPSIRIENLVSSTAVQFIYRSSLKRTFPIVYGSARRRESPYLFRSAAVNRKLAFPFEFVVHVPNNFFGVNDSELDGQNEKLQNFLTIVKRYQHIGIRFCLVNTDVKVIWPFIEGFDQSITAEYVNQDIN